MWPYYLLVFYEFFIITFILPRLGDKRRWKFLLMILPMFFIAVFRGNGNGDYFTYLDRGEMVKSWDDVLHKNKVGMEIGYRATAYMVRVFRLPRQYTVAIMNVISLACITAFIKKNSKDWCFSLLLFMPLFLQFDMHAARTAVAIGICALNYTYIKERNLIKFLIVVGVACLFHTIALISVPLYFMYDKYIDIKSGLLILGIEILFIRSLGIYNLLAIIFERLHLSYFAEKLMTYTTSAEYGYALKLYDPRIWIGIVIFIFFGVTVPEKDVEDKFLSNAIFMYSFVIILFSNTTFFAYRLCAFYYTYILLLIPRATLKYHYHSEEQYLSSSKIKRIRLFYGLNTIFTILNLFYASNLLEYKTVFETKFGLLPY